MGGGIILMALGVIFLMYNFDMLSLAFLKLWWPVILIVAGLAAVIRHLAQWRTPRR